MWLSDSVSCSFYMNIFKRYSFILFWKMSQNCEQFSYEIFLGDFGGPKWSPHPTPSVNVKVPFRGKNIETNVFPLFFFIILMEKWTTGWIYQKYTKRIQIYAPICSYIQMFTLNLIQSFKITEKKHKTFNKHQIIFPSFLFYKQEKKVFSTNKPC